MIRTLPFWLVIFLLGCATPRAPQFDPTIVDRAHWAAIASTGSGCPNLTGRYLIKGLEYSEIVRDGRLEPYKIGAAEALTLMAHPRTKWPGPTLVEEHAAAELGVPADLNSFFIRQPSSDEIEIIAPVAGRLGRVKRIILDKNAGDFTCLDGVAKIRETTTEGFSGSYYKMVIDRSIAKLRDGSLVYHVAIYDKTSQFFLFTVTRELSTYSKFPRSD